jgi:hypothetical protein
VVRLTLDFYRRNYIEGLFLSSGIVKSSDFTMEQLVRVARSLREEPGFGGYIHLTRIPPDRLIWEAEEPASPMLGLDLFAAATSQSAARGSPVSTPAQPEASSSPGDSSGLPGEPAVAASRGAWVPHRFLELAETASCHSDPGRWTLLSRGASRV